MSIEQCYEITIQLYTILLQLITAICLTKFCAAFMERQSRLRWWIGGTYLAVSLTLYYMPFVIGNFAAYFLSIFAAFLVFLLLDQKNRKTKVFLMCTFFTVRWVGVSIPTTLTDYLSAHLDVIFSQNEKLLYTLFALNGLLDLALETLLLAFAVHIIDKVFVYKQRDMDAREFVILLLPSLEGMVCYQLFQVVEQPHYKLVCGVILYATVVGTIVLYQRSKQSVDEEQARLLLENEVKDVKSHIAAVEQLYAQVRALRHDIGNHVQVMEGLLEQGNIAEAKLYLEPLVQSAQALELSVHSGNPVTDVILHEKKRMAQERAISFESDFHYPNADMVNAFDLSIILSNVLDNAIEAAGEDGYVKISSYRNHNAFLITVENSYHGVFACDGTSKADRDAHGWGLRNVRAVAAKYHGDVLLEQDGECVKTTVMLMIGE